MYCESKSSVVIEIRISQACCQSQVNLTLFYPQELREQLGLRRMETRDLIEKFYMEKLHAQVGMFTNIAYRVKHLSKDDNKNFELHIPVCISMLCNEKSKM